jgi:hypothetical protein
VLRRARLIPINRETLHQTQVLEMIKYHFLI